MTSIRVIAEGQDRVFLLGNTVRIGRAADADIVLGSPAVSPHHARIVSMGDRWWLTAEAGNDFQVGGQPVTTIPLDGPVTAMLGPRGEASVYIEPITVHTSAAQPSAAQLGAAQPSAAQRGAGQPSAAQLGAAQPSAAQPGAAQPAFPKPAAHAPDRGQQAHPTQAHVQTVHVELVPAPQPSAGHGRVEITPPLARSVIESNRGRRVRRGRPKAVVASVVAAAAAASLLGYILAGTAKPVPAPAARITTQSPTATPSP
jgi:hypothetical protein